MEEDERVSDRVKYNENKIETQRRRDILRRRGKNGKK